MNPLPNINDAEAMAQAGRRSVLRIGRKDAIECLRDAYTALQSAEWGDIHARAQAAKEAAERLQTIAAMWNEL